MHNILIPFDFSDASSNAAEYAIHLFGKNSKYILVNIIDADYRKSVKDMSDDLLKYAKIDLEKEIKRLEEMFGDLQIERQAHIGVITTNILDEIRSHDINYIVMGTTGKSAVEQIFLGSVSTEIIQTASTPVIVVPPKAKYHDLSNIVFSADYKGISPKAHMEIIQKFCSDFELHLDIINVSDVGSQVNEEEKKNALKLDEYFSNIDHRFHNIESNSVVDSIVDFVDEKDAQMLVMISREHGFFYRLTHPSVSAKVSQRSNIPILVLHDD